MQVTANILVGFESALQGLAREKDKSNQGFHMDKRKWGQGRTGEYLKYTFYHEYLVAGTKAHLEKR